MKVVKPKKRRWMCPDCGEKFDSLEAVLAHILKQHPEPSKKEHEPD